MWLSGVFIGVSFFYTYDVDSKAIRATLGLYTILSAIEYCIIITARTFRAYWKSGKTAKGHTLFIFVTFALFLVAIIGSSDLERAIWKNLKAFQILTIFRLIHFSQMASRMVFVTAKMSNILSMVLVIIAMSLMFYVYVGMESFSTYVATSRSDNDREFGKYTSAVATVFQMFVGESWNDILASKILEDGTENFHDVFSATYF